MQKNNTEKFLEKYKKLEAAIAEASMIPGVKGSPGSVYELEDMLENEENKNRLRVCRIMRNYMQHNAPEFVAITDGQLDFLDRMTETVTGRKRLVKDNMKRIQKPLTINDSIQTGLEYLAKRSRDWMPVVDKDGYVQGIVTYKVLGTALAQGLTLRTKIVKAGLSKEYESVSPDDELSKIDKDIIYVVESGKKLIGIICHGNS